MSNEVQELRNWLDVAAPVSLEAISIFLHSYDILLSGAVTNPTPDPSNWGPLWLELYRAGWVAITCVSAPGWVVKPTDAGAAAYAALTKAAQ